MRGELQTQIYRSVRGSKIQQEEIGARKLQEQMDDLQAKHDDLARLEAQLLELNELFVYL